MSATTEDVARATEILNEILAEPTTREADTRVKRRARVEAKKILRPEEED
jgi:hypothetical protein